MKRTAKGVAVGLVVVALAGGAFIGGQHVSAQGPGRGFGPGRSGPPGMGPGRPGAIRGLMLGRLDLTQDQRDRVKQILDSHREEHKALATRAMIAHDALQSAVSSLTFDEAAIRARAADVAAVDADQAVAHARISSEVMQILTPDQQTKLKTLQDERKKRVDTMRAHRAERQGARQ